MKHFLLLALAFVFAACGVSPRRGLYYQRGGNRQPAAQSTSARVQGNDPVEVFPQINAVLHNQGFVPLGNTVRGQLPPNGLTAYAVSAGRSPCVVIYAVAAPGQDLDLVVTDSAGRVLDQDIRPDPHPWVSVCPGTAGRLTARVQMRAGQGLYYFAAYGGSTRTDLAGFFGTQTGARIAEAPIDPQTGSRVAALDQRMRQDGFFRTGDPRGLIPRREREDVVLALSLLPQHCYTFASLGGPGANNTDLFIVDGAGAEVVKDNSSERDAIVRYCPSQQEPLQLRARMYSGQGPLFLVAYLQGNGAANAQEDPDTQIVAGDVSAGGNLDDNFRVLDGDMRARGYEEFGSVERGELAESGSQNIAVELEGGKCYAMVAVGDTGTRDLDLSLIDGSGRELDRDVEDNARPTVRVCPGNSGRYQMRVRMVSGQGAFVYRTYRWPRGIAGPFGLRGVMWVRASEMVQLLTLEGYALDNDFTPERQTLASQGTSRTHTVSLRQGSCYAIDAIGGEGVEDLSLELARGDAALRTDSTRNAFPSVRFCPDSTGRYTVRVTATSGQGPYVLRLFTAATSEN